MLSWDIRNPLSLIIGYTKIREEELTTRRAKERNQSLPRLEGTVMAVNTLVTNVLDVSRIETGHVTLVKKSLHFAPLLQQPGCQCEFEILERQVQPQVLVERHPPQRIADDMPIERRISNLLSNGSKITPPSRCFTLTERFPGPDIIATAKDIEPGITTTNIPFLIENCRREQTPQQGVGFGLFFVNTFAEALGGRVTVDSHRDHTGRSDHGTCFSVLPPIEAQSTDSIGLNCRAVPRNNKLIPCSSIIIKRKETCICVVSYCRSVFLQFYSLANWLMGQTGPLIPHIRTPNLRSAISWFQPSGGPLEG